MLHKPNYSHVYTSSNVVNVSIVDVLRCTPRSECTDAAAAANRWKSLTGRYSNCAIIIHIVPSELSLQRRVSVNVRTFSINLFVKKYEIHGTTVAATVA